MKKIILSVVTTFFLSVIFFNSIAQDNVKKTDCCQVKAACTLTKEECANGKHACTVHAQGENDKNKSNCLNNNNNNTNCPVTKAECQKDKTTRPDSKKGCCQEIINNKEE